MGACPMKTAIYTSALALAVSACASGAGSEPERIYMPYGPSQAPAVGPAPASTAETGSLWDTSPNALLALRRAKDVGDLLTVVVQMNDQASLESSLSRNRSTDDNLDIRALLGLPDLAGAALPNGASVSPAIDFGRQSSLNGGGSVERAEQIAFRLAARVIGVEPNGNLIIQGYQQTLVSNEVRYLSVSGVIRSQDITRTNTVSYDKIADAQFSYVSEGEATGAVGRRAAPKVLDRYVPF